MTNGKTCLTQENRLNHHRLDATEEYSCFWDSQASLPIRPGELQQRLGQWVRNQSHYSLLLTLLVFALGAMLGSGGMLVKMAPRSFKMGILSLVISLWFGVSTYICLHWLVSDGEIRQSVCASLYYTYSFSRVLWLGFFLLGLFAFSINVVLFVLLGC